MALRVGGIGTWHWDIASGHIDWDASMEELYGFAPGTFDGTYETYAARLHPEDRPLMQAALQQALDERRPEYVVAHRTLLPDGEVRWFSSTARLILDDAGAPAELVGVAVDVTERRRAELGREVAQRRLEMLARVSSLLDAPLDLTETLQQVADLALVELADWCFVDLVAVGGVQPAVVAHGDPAMVEVARRLQARFPQGPGSPRQLVLDRLEPVYVREVTEELLDQFVADPELRGRLDDLAMTSYLAVPLVAGRRGVGVMVLIGDHGHHLEPDDVDLAVELGRRAGAAVDKARLYADLRQTADTLQASLLPASLPEIGGVALSAHYRPGTFGLDIGGDYYDAFRTAADRWWVVLGDVCGKGPAAAAMTAAVRYTLHALAPDTDDPAVLLRRLNEHLLRQDWGTRFTTLVLATFRAPVGAGGGAVDPSSGPLVLRIVSGGHPPALIRRADGRVEEVSSRGTLVGLLRTIRADAVDISLAPGDALVLYTDGATEAMDADGHLLGETTLQALVGRLDVTDPDPAGRLAEAVIAEATGGLRDDLALLTLTRPPKDPAS